jgi:CheY-like chemotaxis protein
VGLLEGCHVLVVEGDAETRSLLHAILEHEGARVSDADDAERALALILTAPCDLILTDIALGSARRDGVWLRDHVRAIPRLASVRVVALTAQKERRGQLSNLGFDSVVLKPINPDALAAQLANVLRVR